MTPPVARPPGPPLDAPPGSKSGDTTAAPPVRELPKWLRWETYGACSHDEQCRPKMFAVATVAVIGVILLATWVGGKDVPTGEEEKV